MFSNRYNHADINGRKTAKVKFLILTYWMVSLGHSFFKFTNRFSFFFLLKQKETIIMLLLN